MKLGDKYNYHTIWCKELYIEIITHSLKLHIGSYRIIFTFISKIKLTFENLLAKWWDGSTLDLKPG